MGKGFRSDLPYLCDGAFALSGTDELAFRGSDFSCILEEYLVTFMLRRRLGEAGQRAGAKEGLAWAHSV